MKRIIIVVAAVLITIFAVSGIPTEANALTVRISCDKFCVAGDTVEFAIAVSGFKGETVDGFAIRLYYDQHILTDPIAVTAGTLCEGMPVEEGVPDDGMGNYSLGVLSGLDAFDDGVLIKVRFNVAATNGDLKTLGFVQPGVKTVLYDNGFSPIPATWINANFM